MEQKKHASIESDCNLSPWKEKNADVTQEYFSNPNLFNAENT